MQNSPPENNSDSIEPKPIFFLSSVFKRETPLVLWISVNPSCEQFLSLEDAFSIGGSVHLNKAILPLTPGVLLAPPSWPRSQGPAWRQEPEELGTPRCEAVVTGWVLTPPPFIMSLNRMAWEAAFIACLFKVITTCISSLLVLLKQKGFGLHYTIHNKEKKIWYINTTFSILSKAGCRVSIRRMVPIWQSS